MSTPSELNEVVLPQNVVGPLTRSAIFLVLCIRQDDDATVRLREFCAGLSGLIRAVEFRDVEAGLLKEPGTLSVEDRAQIVARGRREANRGEARALSRRRAGG